jgi:hypothetical protein
VLACVVAAAPFILPVVAWLPYSTRGEAFDAFEYERFNLLPMRAAELFLPYLLRDRHLSIWSDFYETYSRVHHTPLPWVLSEYVGAAGLALALLGAARARAARVLLSVAAVALWMAMGAYAGFGQIARQLPILSGFRYWEKVAGFAHLLVPAAAAYGVAALGERSRAVRRLAIAAAAASALLLAAQAAARAWPDALARAVVLDGHLDHAELLAENLAAGALHAGVALALLALVALLALRGRVPRLALTTLALGVVVGDLAVANVTAYALYPLDTVKREGPIVAHVASAPGLRRLITPFTLWTSSRTRLGAENGPNGEQTADVAWAIGSRSLASAFNTGVAGNFEAYTGMIPVREMRYRRRTGLYDQLPGAGIWSIEWMVVPENPTRAKQMGLAPPYRVVAADPLLALSLVEVPHRPRAYLAADLESVDRRQAMEFVLDGTSVTSSRSVIEGPVPPDYRAPHGGVRIASDEPERVVLEATSDGPALVVLNDVYTGSGWTASVDGRPAEILPANYMARGVWIGAGAHTLVFTYRTPLLREGWAVLLAGLFGLGALAVRTRRRPFSSLSASP